MTNPTIRGRLWRSVSNPPTPYIIALFLFPLLLLAINDSWVFPPTGWIDAWIYSGYHMHIARLLQDIPSAYYSSRVPWTVLGWAVHRVATPEVSFFVLALLLVYASTFSLFYVVYNLFNNAAAGFIAACLLATHSLFLVAAGWNYVDGPLIACIFVSLAALVEVARGRYWGAAAVLWGIITAAMLAIYLMNAVILPIELLIFAAIYRLALGRPARFIALLWFSGFAGAVLAMGLANHLVGGSVNFLAPTLAVLGALTPAGTKDVYYAPWSGWLPIASWMVLPGIIAVASLAFILARAKYVLEHFQQIDSTLELSREAMLLILSTAYLLTICGFGFMQRLHWDMLSLFFRANTLLPFAFPVVGGFLALSLSKTSVRSQFGLASSAAIICLTPWVLGAFGAVHAPLPAFSPGQSQIMLHPAKIIYGDSSETIWVFAGSALLIGIWLVPFRSFLLLPVTFFSALSIVLVSESIGIRLPNDPGVRNRTLTAFDAAGIIDSKSSDRFVLWWNPTDLDADIFLSLGSMYLDPSPSRIRPGDRVVFLGSRESPLTIANPLLARDHLIVESPDRERVHRGTVSFGLDIAQIALDPRFFGSAEVQMTKMAPPPAFSNGDADVTTPAVAWAYGAVLPLPEELKSAHPSSAFIRVRLRVKTGDMGVGITTKDGGAWIDREFIRNSPVERDIYLTVPALKDAGALVFCSNGAPVASAASVQSVAILYAKKRGR